jgi:hypothetical protein
MSAVRRQETNLQQSLGFETWFLVASNEVVRECPNKRAFWPMLKGSEMTEDNQNILIQEISKALVELDSENDLVLCSDDPNICAKKIAASVKGVIPDTGLTSLEMHGVRSLILYAIENQSFFDWEMATLSGFSAAQFKTIAGKFPRE